MEMSTSLNGLLRYLKGEKKPDCTWQGIALALAPFYSDKMTFVDVIQVVMNLYEEALSEGRFELGNGPNAYRRVVLAPINGFHAIDWPTPKNGLETQYSVEQYYNAVIAEMTSSLRMARVDWCWHSAAEVEAGSVTLAGPSAILVGDDLHERK